jgi:hypothetical protein
LPSRNTPVNTSTLVWESPPATAKATADPHRFEAEAGELKANPGRWAVLTTVGTGSQAYRLRKAITEGKLAAFAPAGAYEVKSAKNGDGIKVYVRFATDVATATEQASATPAQ